jgi:hypothetical protein
VNVEVRSRVPGASAEPLPSVVLELAGTSTTLRDLIRSAVTEQVRATRIDAARSRAMLDRQYLTADDVAAQARTGAVRLPAVPVDPPDEGTEVRRALRAFEAGAFVVFCGGRQVETLDEPVTPRPGEPVVFLRLAPLVGG